MATPLKILFADDDLKYSLLLKRFLEKEGYDVAYTGNGMMVLEQFPVVKPDLVLLDINMPGLNGFEVAEKIRGKRSPCPDLFPFRPFGQKRPPERLQPQRK